MKEFGKFKQVSLLLDISFYILAHLVSHLDKLLFKTSTK